MTPRLTHLLEELHSIKLALSYGNRMPPRSSSWYDFAKKFDIGVKDLDNLALDLGYHTFRKMDKNATPKEAMEEKGEDKLIKALRATSLLAYGMNTGPLKRLLKKVIR